jgi:hypothetical protein
MGKTAFDPPRSMFANAKGRIVMADHPDYSRAVQIEEAEYYRSEVAADQVGAGQVGGDASPGNACTTLDIDHSVHSGLFDAFGADANLDHPDIASVAAPECAIFV